MTIVIVDVETTGLTSTNNSIVEIAFVTMSDKGAILETFTSLIKPMHPISFPAMAVHHITENMVRRAPSLTKFLLQVSKKMGPDKPACYVAHNAEFDSSFLPALTPWLCTWRCSLHLWPEAPGYSNSILRYWLPGLDNERQDNAAICELPPHRALPDAWTTAFILRRMLTKHSLVELLELTSKPVLLRTCWVGEHSGKLWSEVPKSFCEWLLSKGPKRSNPNGGRDLGFAEDIRHTAKHYLNA